MEVNRQWWSGTERYINNSNRIDAEHVITTVGDLSEDIPLNPTKYIGVEWDKTICPWKINYKSDFFNPQWCLPYNQSGGSFKMVQAPFFKQRKKGYTFYMCAAGGVASYQPHERLSYYAATKPCWVNLLSRSDIDITQNPSQQWVYEKYYKTFPVVNFDYSKLFAFPMIHIENGNGHLFRDTAQAREDWDATGVYGVSIMFGVKTPYNGTDIVSVGIHSLNNEIAPPPWDTTNCWNDDKMFDNGLALTHWNAWDGGYEIGGIQTLGTECTWSDSSASAGDPGFNDTEYPSDNVAGAILYYPAKNIMIQMPADNDDETLWDDWESYYKGGSHEYSVRRHLKSTVTFDQFANYLKKQLAYLGFRFCVDAEHLNDSINSQYFFIPVIDEKGVTTGGFYQANSAEAETLPNYNWTNDVYTETPYDGTDDEEDDDPNDYDETLTTDLNPYATTYHSKFLNYYLLDSAALASIIDYVYTDLPTNQPETDFLTNNPIDSIVSIMMFPFNVEYQPEWYYPFFGKVKCTTASVHIPKSHIQIIDCGQHLFYPYFGENDFRNYTPYTSAELYLPYCGNVKIEPTIYLNKLIGIKYIVDLITGACTALIFRAEKGAQNYGLLTEMINGQIGITLPTTGIKSNDLQRDILNKQAAYRQASNTAMISGANAALSLFSMAANPSVGGAVGALNSVLNWDSATERQNIANYDVKHIQVPFSVKGSASSICALAEEPTPYLTIRYAKMLPEYNAEIYAHTVGYACIINDLISNYSGYAEITGVDLSGIVATDEEKTMIKNYLESGVYL